MDTLAFGRILDITIPRTLIGLGGRGFDSCSERNKASQKALRCPDDIFLAAATTARCLFACSSGVSDDFDFDRFDINFSVLYNRLRRLDNPLLSYMIKDVIIYETWTED
jgi:hypothetical protein